MKSGGSLKKDANCEVRCILKRLQHLKTTFACDRKDCSIAIVRPYALTFLFS